MTKSPIPMPVVPCSVNLFQHDRELHKFLLNCQNNFPRTGKDHTQIVSISQKIAPIDPLVFIQAIAESRQLHFYWENPRKKEAIAAYGITTSLVLNTGNRFSQAKKFVHQSLKRIVNTGDLQLPGAGPHFFSSFTFFPTATNSEPSPFPSATIFLPRFQITKKKNNCVFIANIALNETIDIDLLLEQLQKKIKALHKAEQLTNQNQANSAKKLQITNINNHQKFKSSVISALKLIQNNQLDKIVIAQALDVLAPVNFNVIEALNNLRQIHPDCYTFSISNSQGDYFIGASPERLISIQNQQLVTDALAGSAPRGKNSSEDTFYAKRLLKSGKERREHKAVSEFIIERLAQLGLSSQKLPLQLLQLSNIQHLWTPIYAQLPPHINPFDVVAKLHPTPAVAGVPTHFACQKIIQYENFDRCLYASPLGWIDHQSNSEFIVGIRSALIQKNHARIYAGAGIVAGSEPEQEYAEIQLKLQSLLKALAS